MKRFVGLLIFACLLLLAACGGEVTAPSGDLPQNQQEEIGQNESQKDETQTSEQDGSQVPEENQQTQDEPDPCEHPRFLAAVDSQPVWAAVCDWYYAGNRSRICEVCGQWGLKTMCSRLSFRECIESLKNGGCDVILVPVSGAMVAELEGYVVTPVLRDGIVFIRSNADNCAGFGLSGEKIRLAFTAEETICWDDDNTDPILPASGWFDTEPSLWQHVEQLFGFSAASSHVIFAAEGENCIQAIEASGRTGSGLWPCYFSSVGGDVGTGSGEMIAVDGVYPTEQTIADGSYPYAFAYCAVYAADNACAEEIEAFVEQMGGNLPQNPGEEPVRLTEEELRYFTGLFVNDEAGKTFPSMLLSSEYDAPENIHLGWLFREGVPNENGGWGYDISGEELAALQSVLTEEEYEGFLMRDACKTPRSAMDELLMQWLGLSLEDTHEHGLEFLTYLEEFGAYYSAVSDTNMVIPEFSGGIRREDGMIELRYRPRWSSGPDTHILVLRPVGESYQFVSNLPVDGK